MTVDKNVFDQAYVDRTAPWVLGAAQPELIAEETAGHIGESVLDVGCGLGDNALHLAARGHDVLGIDPSPEGIRRARANAAERDSVARFTEGDALRLDESPGLEPESFDAVVDSGVFHIFGSADHGTYTRNLHHVLRPGGAVFLLVAATLSEEQQDQAVGPPRVDAADIRAAFGPGWQIEELRSAGMDGIAQPELAESFGVDPGQRVTTPAWFARIRRV